MRAGVYFNGILAGYLEKSSGGYVFQYEQMYIASAELPSISLTLPKRTEPYTSEVLFPFFFGLLTEGVNKTIQCRELKIDENDHFNRLVKTIHSDSIGAITIKSTEP